MNKQFLTKLIEAKEELQEEIDKLGYTKQEAIIKSKFAKLDGLIQGAELYFKINTDENKRNN